MWQKIKVHRQKEPWKNCGNVVTKTPSFTISVKRYENNQGTFSMLALLLCSKPHQCRWFKGKSLRTSLKYFYYFIQNEAGSFIYFGKLLTRSNPQWRHLLYRHWKINFLLNNRWKDIIAFFWAQLIAIHHQFAIYSLKV